MPDVTPCLHPGQVRRWIAFDQHKFSIVAATLPPRVDIKPTSQLVLPAVHPAIVGDIVGTRGIDGVAILARLEWPRSSGGMVIHTKGGRKSRRTGIGRTVDLACESGRSAPDSERSACVDAAAFISLEETWKVICFRPSSRSYSSWGKGRSRPLAA